MPSAFYIMAKFQDQYDSAFLGILQNEGQIAGFLDAVFGFLFRRTDFYVELTSKAGKMGFPPGVSEKLTLQAFKKYEKAAKQQQALYKEQQRRANEQEKAKAADQTLVEPAEVQASGVNVATGSSTTVSSTNATNTNSSDTVSNITQPSSSQDSPRLNSGNSSSEKNEQKIDVKSEHSEDTASAMDVCASNTSDDSKPGKTDNEDDDDSELARQQKLFQANPESYNGAVRDNYSWSQSITDLDLKILTPEHVKKGKDVQVEIQRNHICAQCKSPSGGWQTLLDGDLPWEVDKEESMWSLEPGKCILVNLEKKQERWWECVLKDEPKINVRKIEASRPMSDLDDEAQAKIEEMMYNEHQKKLGLPQSHETKVQGMLKKAWDAEGSPFKGQPYDPSKLNISPDGSMNIGNH